jgi:hypothetical protein
VLLLSLAIPPTEKTRATLVWLMTARASRRRRSARIQPHGSGERSRDIADAMAAAAACARGYISERDLFQRGIKLIPSYHLDPLDLFQRGIVIPGTKMLFG